VGDQFGAYVNWRLQPLASVTADLGLRWDKETLSSVDSTRISPRLGLLWTVDEATRIRVGWGRFFQAQGVDELSVSDGETQFFRAQRADHLVASIERSLGARFDLRLEGYHKSYDRLRPRYENLFDTLVVLPELKPDRAMLDPLRASVDGAELSLGYDDNEGLSGWLSYSWSSAKDRLQRQNIRRSWDQTHYLSAGISQRGERWDWSLAASWHSGWPTTDIALVATEPLPLVAAGRRNARHIGNYARLDARLARRFSFGADNALTVFLEISNVSNRKNDCCVEYQIETDTGATLLDVSTRSTLPLIPSVGFTWTF
jgi:outer membrane receptor protein involved in Fe transport